MYQGAVEIRLGGLQPYPPPRLFLNMDVIIATTGSIAPITKVRFKEWTEVRKNCVMLGKGFWDMAISLSYEAFRQRCRLSVAFDNSDYM